ncbi:MAG: hypothetical protein KGV51_08010 [Moraxellaceae bacterium]|nr:hypothetical protein [Moraxellaceae bacterium]
MKHILVDYENVMPNNFDIISDIEEVHIWLFLGLYQQRVLSYALVKSLFQFNSKHIHFIDMHHQGKDALDHYLSFYLGKISEIDKNAQVYILSRDCGYDLLIEHLHKTYKQLKVWRVASLEAIVDIENPQSTPTTPQIPSTLIAEVTVHSSQVVKPPQTAKVKTVKVNTNIKPPKQLEKELELVVTPSLIYKCTSMTLKLMLQEQSYLPKRLNNLYSAIKNYAIPYQIRDLSELQTDYLIRKVIERLQKQGLIVVENEEVTYKLTIADLLHLIVSHVLTVKPKSVTHLKEVIEQKLINFHQPSDENEVELIVQWLQNNDYLTQEQKRVFFATDEVEEDKNYKMTKNYILQTPKLNRPKKVKTLQTWLKDKLKALNKKDIKQIIKSLQENNEIILDASGKVTYNF